MIRAILFLRLASLGNRVLVSLRRLRQPKYLAGAAAGAAYLYYFLFARFRGPGAGYGATALFGNSPLPPLYAQSLLHIGGAVLFIIVLWRQAVVWKTPPAEAGLHFSEAEIAFLFPAPLSRRRLMHFSLLKGQVVIFLSSVFLSVFFNRRGGPPGTGLIQALGWWVILSTLSFHTTGISLAVVRLRQSRPDFPRLRQYALALVAILGGAAVLTFYRAIAPVESPDLAHFTDMLAFLGRALDAGVLHLLLAPFTLVVAPFLAGTLEAFWRALLPALLILAALYWWIIRLEVPFEDGSIAQAEHRSRLRAERRGGGFAPDRETRPLREPFSLAPRGRPELAFLWKNLFAIQSWFNLRLFLAGIIFVAAMVWSSTAAGHGFGRASSYAPLALAGAGLLAFYTLLAGPQLLRQDLRGDLANADLLKTYPLAGWQVVLGEILTPLAVLSGLLWLALLMAVWALAQIAAALPWFTPGFRFVLTGCLALLIPPVCVLQLLIPNAAALLFPTWFQASRTRSGSIEIIGQRLIFASGQLLAILAALVPALLTAALVVFASQWLIGLAAATLLGTAAILVILLGEAWCGIWWLGQKFERLEISET